MEYKYKNIPDSKGSISGDGHTMFLEDVVRNIKSLQAENKELKSKLEAAEKFEKHIKAHLKDGEEVICKICGKTAKEISTLREKGE